MKIGSLSIAILILLVSFSFASAECVKEGERVAVLPDAPECCEGLTKISVATYVKATTWSAERCIYVTSSICSNCGNGKCESWENKCNCKEDCEIVIECKKEGESIPVIPNPPECCEGLTLIPPISSNIVGISGYCTAKCGDGTCNTQIESSYNCPEDCKTTIECNLDSDCLKERPYIYCEGNNLCTKTTDYSCINNKCVVTGGGTKCITCEYECKGGVCISETEIKEQVKCIFVGSTEKQKCYTANENERAYCSGKDSCVAEISGYKGEEITWKSTCGGYAYTLIDGINEYAKFDCSKKNVCKDSDNGKDIYRKGTTSGLDWGSDVIVDKTDYCITEGEKTGKLVEYYCEYINGVSRVASQSFGAEDGCYDCEDGACQQIIVKPVCGNGICESGEGEICECPAMPASCKLGKECKVLPCRCYVDCPQDCKREEIYINLNEEFKLQVYQSVKIIEDEKILMKITFKDLIAYKCKEVEASETKKIKEKAAVAEATMTGKAASEASSGGASETAILKCIGAGPKALLDIDISEKHRIVNLDIGEKKQVGEFTISFLGYDYASRTGAFLVSRETFFCPEKCRCDENGEIIECSEDVCKEGETLCPDGKCREKCDIIVEECRFGCLYEGKCFPIGVRSEGMYCSTDLIMTSQLKEEQECNNNFECQSNLCLNDECISKNLIQKILDFFKKWFGVE